MTAYPPAVEELVRRGIAAAREGLNGNAQQLLREAVRLAPNHEQAWLWLSGVEDSDPQRLAALQEVLRINPNNVAAQRGIEKLTQPKPLDFASVIGPTAAPAPARVASDSGPLPPRPAPPPAQSAPSPPSVAPAASTPATIAEAPAAPVGADALDDLRPALARVRRKRQILPRPSELVILGGLLLLVMVFFFGMRTWLKGKEIELRGGVDDRSVITAPTATPPRLQPTPIPGAARADQNGAAASRTYTLQISGVQVDARGGVLTVTATLRNTGPRPVAYSSSDFSLRNGANATLSMITNSERSTLLAVSSLNPGQAVAGTLVFSGDVTRSPIRMTWQPTNGALSREFNIR